MSKRESVARYNLIINKLRRTPSTFSEILDYLELESEIQGYDFIISTRTFQRDRNDIRSLYNIDIRYDHSKKVYYIDADSQPDANERMLEAFDTFNALNLADRLSEHIYFEKRKPQGTENLHGLLHAIKNRHSIKFTYEKYWEEGIGERHIEPYALKEFKHRWYVHGKDLNDGLNKSFSLDRLSNLEISKQQFEMPSDFDVEEYFKYSYGIVSPNAPKPEEVILSFAPGQGKYIKSLPLHESQEILIDNDEELRIKLKLYITTDFRMELLSMGPKLKVIQPKRLIEEIKKSCEDVIRLYK